MNFDAEDEKRPITVVFRKWQERDCNHSDGSIIALFPEINENYGLCSSYMHVGQHGAADCASVINRTYPAAPDEYADLAKELEGIGYVLHITTRNAGRRPA